MASSQSTYPDQTRSHSSRMRFAVYAPEATTRSSPSRRFPPAPPPTRGRLRAQPGSSPTLGHPGPDWSTCAKQSRPAPLAPRAALPEGRVGPNVLLLRPDQQPFRTGRVSLLQRTSSECAGHPSSGFRSRVNEQRLSVVRRRHRAGRPRRPSRATRFAVRELTPAPGRQARRRRRVR
jgi:hypothetical protein